MKVSKRAVVELHFDLQFNVVASSRLLAQGARLFRSRPAPHMGRRDARQLASCDALAGDEPQFVFALGQRHGRRAWLRSSSFSTDSPPARAAAQGRLPYLKTALWKMDGTL